MSKKLKNRKRHWNPCHCPYFAPVSPLSECNIENLLSEELEIIELEILKPFKIVAYEKKRTTP